MNRSDTTFIPTEDMHRADIVAALHKKKISLRRLSVENGWAANTLNNALDRPWRAGEEVIAKALGLTPQDIWPIRWANRAS